AIRPTLSGQSLCYSASPVELGLSARPPAGLVEFSGTAHVCPSGYRSRCLWHIPVRICDRRPGGLYCQQTDILEDVVTTPQSGAFPGVLSTLSRLVNGYVLAQQPGRH